VTSPSTVPAHGQFLFTSETGVAFRAIYLQQTETQGYTGSLVRFYDTGFPVEQYGQYVSGYYVSTLLDDYHALCERGLCLDGRVSTWSIDPASMRSVLDWLKTKPVVRFARCGDAGG
jgi:hypothetical protein